MNSMKNPTLTVLKVMALGTCFYLALILSFVFFKMLQLMGVL